GGFILADACCGTTRFDTGFKKLMKEVLPEGERELRPLPPGHPIWTARHHLAPDSYPLMGIDMPGRTAVVYSGKDLSAYWNQCERSPSSSAVSLALRIGQNVIEYATSGKPPAAGQPAQEKGRKE